MIARVWRGVVAHNHHQEYTSYVEATGVADSQSPVEILAFSIWDNEADIQGFAGSDINAMVLFPRTSAFSSSHPRSTITTSRTMP